jgi:hypothetical protein
MYQFIDQLVLDLEETVSEYPAEPVAAEGSWKLDLLAAYSKLAREPFEPPLERFDNQAMTRVYDRQKCATERVWYDNTPWELHSTHHDKDKGEMKVTLKRRFKHLNGSALKELKHES